MAYEPGFLAMMDTRLVGSMYVTSDGVIMSENQERRVAHRVTQRWRHG